MSIIKEETKEFESEGEVEEHGAPNSQPHCKEPDQPDKELGESMTGQTHKSNKMKNKFGANNSSPVGASRIAGSQSDEKDDYNEKIHKFTKRISKEIRVTEENILMEMYLDDKNEMQNLNKTPTFQTPLSEDICCGKSRNGIQYKSQVIHKVSEILENNQLLVFPQSLPIRSKTSRILKGVAKFQEKFYISGSSLSKHDKKTSSMMSGKKNLKSHQTSKDLVQNLNNNELNKDVDRHTNTELLSNTKIQPKKMKGSSEEEPQRVPGPKNSQGSAIATVKHVEIKKRFNSLESRKDGSECPKISQVSPVTSFQSRFATPNTNVRMNERLRIFMKPPIPSLKELRERSRRIGKPPLRSKELGLKISKTLDKSDDQKIDPMLRMYQKFKKKLTCKPKTSQMNSSSLPDISARNCITEDISYDDYSKLRKKGWDGSLSHKLFSGLAKRLRIKRYAELAKKNHTPHQSQAKKRELRERIKALKQAQKKKKSVHKYKLRHFKRVRLDELPQSVKSRDFSLKMD
ncbi:unnamed protein product [Moneuplotes crassus]|uniref:Uncharacterized protein n=1 Tax=Euplotes crassus TaxID=5936 RepID=A0AAD1U1Y6_EUPCR|nr:unnamed protein product [Moneuplotes crassus]